MALGSLSAGIILPGFAAMASAAGGKSCHGNFCDPVKEYCDNVSESCKSCGESGGICDVDSHNYHPDTCTRECSAFLMSEIKAVYNQQNVMLIILIVVLVLIALQYSWQFVRWVIKKRYITQILKKLHLNKQQAMNEKDINGHNATTIQNVMTINEMERAPSQIYSVTGAEGSVMTMTTPVSTRYPAEDTTPTNAPAEYSYDNQALAVTPVSEKPSSNRAF